MPLHGRRTYKWALLDLLSDRGKQLNGADWSQALQSCRNAAAPAAAWYLYGQMLNHSVEPNVIVFSHLMGAHSNSSVAAIRKVIHNMTESKVKPDTPFVEEHIGALLGTRYMGTANQARLAVTTHLNHSVLRHWMSYRDPGSKG